MPDGTYLPGHTMVPEDVDAPQIFSDEEESDEDPDEYENPAEITVVTDDPVGLPPEGRKEEAEALLSEARTKLDAALESDEPITDPEVIKRLFGRRVRCWRTSFRFFWRSSLSSRSSWEDMSVPWYTWSGLFRTLCR